MPGWSLFGATSKKNTPSKKVADEDAADYYAEMQAEIARGK